MKFFPEKILLTTLLCLILALLLPGAIFPIKIKPGQSDERSLQIEVKKLPVKKGEEKHTRIYRYCLIPVSGGVKFKDLKVKALFAPGNRSSRGKLKWVKHSSIPDESGKSELVEVAVLFPRNWRWKTQEIEGKLVLEITGKMTTDSTSQGAMSSIDSSVAPFDIKPLKIKENVSLKIRPEKLLYLLYSLLILIVVGIPAAFIYRTMVPMTVTLRSGGTSRVFDLPHRGKIRIGDPGDFKLDSSCKPVAEIQRRFRRFVLEEKIPNSILSSYPVHKGKMLLKLGEEFKLNIAGAPVSFEFLPGNWSEEESEQEEVNVDQQITEEDLDEGPV